MILPICAMSGRNSITLKMCYEMGFETHKFQFHYLVQFPQFAAQFYSLTCNLQFLGSRLTFISFCKKFSCLQLQKFLKTNLHITKSMCYLLKIVLSFLLARHSLTCRLLIATNLQFPLLTFTSFCGNSHAMIKFLFENLNNLKFDGSATLRYVKQ